MPMPGDGRTQPAVMAAPRSKARPTGSHPGQRSPFEAELGARSAQIIPICVIGAGSDEIDETAPKAGVRATTTTGRQPFAIYESHPPTTNHTHITDLAR